MAVQVLGTGKNKKWRPYGVDGAGPKKVVEDVTVLDRSTAIVTIQNSTTPTDLLRIPLPTTLAPGDHLVLDAYGTLQHTTGSTETPTLAVGIGATSITGFPSAGIAIGASIRSWRLQMRVAMQSMSLHRVYMEWGLSGFTNVNVVATIAANSVVAKTQDITEDLSAGKDIFMRWTFATALSTLRIDRTAYLLWKV